MTLAICDWVNLVMSEEDMLEDREDDPANRIASPNFSMF